ncbi:MAG: VOC family protein [Acidobacteriaceae bacterium]|nr:VOC family protein [Acidobacteriaceae bacterium]
MKKTALTVCLAACLLASNMSSRAADAPARPKILGIAHIAFYVSDLAKAREFWTDFLGYQEVFNLKKPGTDQVRIAFIKINDYQYIELFAEKPRGDMMLNHISFYTGDAQKMRDYLAAKGVKVPVTVPKGKTGNKNYNITDPDGNLVEIVEYQPDSWTAQAKGKFMPSTRISDHISHVGVLIGSVSMEKNFYEGILGFEEIWRGGGGEDKPLSWINERVPDGKDYLECMLHGPKPDPTKYGTKNHLALEVPDCAKAVEILKARPASKDFKMEEMKVGVNRKRQVNIYDPDGSRVELMEPVTIDGKPAPASKALPPIP